jgi:gag-polypeptide of LTR copia-type
VQPRSADLWQSLNQMHSTQSMARVLDLKLQLQTSKKSGSTCSQYSQHMQSLVNRLRSIGVQVSNQDLVLYTLQGLRSEFESFVTAISMRYAPPTMVELHGLLLAHEARMQSNLRALTNTFVHLTTDISQNPSFPGALSYPAASNPSALYANGYQQKSNAYSGSVQGGFGQQSQSNQRFSLNRGKNNYRDRGKGRTSNSNQPQI